MEALRDNPAQAAAETLIRVNPELELLGTDEGAGTITFRKQSDG